jgi:hypothetical protein
MFGCKRVPCLRKLMLKTMGLLSGTPSEAGTYNFTVQGTDSGGGIANENLTIIISPAL